MYYKAFWRYLVKRSDPKVLQLTFLSSTQKHIQDKQVISTRNKTGFQIISSNLVEAAPQNKIVIIGTPINVREDFTYLGSLVSTGQTACADFH